MSWPAREQVIDELLDTARAYALDHDTEHPEDIASELIVAIEVAWRGIKRLDVQHFSRGGIRLRTETLPIEWEYAPPSCDIPLCSGEHS